MRNELDELLKQALTPIDEPDARLNQSIINQVKEQESRKKRIWKRIPAAALVAAIVIGCASMTVAAGVVVRHYLSGGDVAQKTYEDTKLAEAFSGEDAIFINETQSYGGFDVTLLGIVSGKDISDHIGGCNGVLLEDRTYVVVAIAYSDGRQMTEIASEAPEEEFFLVSPFIRGFTPAFCNIVTLDGNYASMVENGVKYYLVEFDNIEIFADHGLYLCVSDRDGYVGYNVEAYQFDEATGIISRNEDYKGLNALFELPIDASKADPEAAENYLKSDELLADKFLGIQSAEEESGDDLDGYDESKDKWRWLHQVTPENIDTYADRLEDSVQVLTPDEKGFIQYEYELAEGGVLLEDQMYPACLKQRKNLLSEVSHSPSRKREKWRPIILRHCRQMMTAR